MGGEVSISKFQVGLGVLMLEALSMARTCQKMVPWGRPLMVMVVSWVVWVSQEEKRESGEMRRR